MAGKIGSEDKEKSLFLIQIRYLKEQLERFQLKREKLEKQYKDFAAQYSVLEKDVRAPMGYLKRFLGAREKKVEELVEQLEIQREEAERDREALRLQHRQEMQELQEQADRLKSENEMQAKKIKEQEELKEQLTRKVSDMKFLEKQLLSQKEEQEAAVHSLMMEAALEREKMIEDIQKTVDDCVETKISDVLQREREQHGELIEQAQFLQGESVPLQKVTDALRDRVMELFVRRDNLRKDLKRITQEGSRQRREFEQLRKKRKQLMMELKDQSTSHQHKLAQIEALRKRLASVSEESHQKMAEANQLGTELQKEQRRRWQLEGDVQEAVTILRDILMDSEKASETRWKMQRLLEILECAAPRGTATALDDPTEKRHRGQRPQTSGPEPARRHCGQKMSSSLDPSAPAPQRKDSEVGASTSADD